MSIEPCDLITRHDRQIAILEERWDKFDNDQQSMVDRVQKLVEQYHAQNILQTALNGDVSHIRGQIDVMVLSLRTDFARRSEFLEIKTEWRRFLGIVLVLVLTAVIGLVLNGGFK